MSRHTCWRRAIRHCQVSVGRCSTAAVYRQRAPSQAEVGRHARAPGSHLHDARDVVLDAFCGSASTCAAALLTGRKYIGIELDDAYYAAASARLDRIHQRTAAKRYAGALAA